MNLATVLRYVEVEGGSFVDWEQRWYIMEYYYTMAKSLNVNLTAVLNAADPEEICANCDGLILPGSAMDIDPKYYGAAPKPPYRDEYALDQQLMDCFLRQGKPVLGICGGFQELNIYFGGTICPIEPVGSHNNGKPHRITVRENSFVWDVYQQPQVEINSYHNWRLDRIAPCLEVVAFSDDGIAEAVQHRELPVFAVQWHPERSYHDPRTSETERTFFANFVELCRKCKS